MTILPCRPLFLTLTSRRGEGFEQARRVNGEAWARRVDGCSVLTRRASWGCPGLGWNSERFRGAGPLRKVRADPGPATTSVLGPPAGIMRERSGPPSGIFV